MFEAFGKLRFHTDGNVSVEHSLIDHMIDVAACFVRLAQCRSIRRALELCAGRKLTEQDIARLAVLAFLHDIGKANSGFQAKRWKAKPPPGWPAPAGHTNEALCIADDENLLSLLPIAEMSAWGSACSGLWRASISHHGQPVKDPTQVDPRIWRPVISTGDIAYDPRTTLQQIGSCLKDWFGQAFETGPELPDSPKFAHLFAGLVQFADWLGSDSDFFRSLCAMKRFGNRPTERSTALASTLMTIAVFFYSCPIFRRYSTCLLHTPSRHEWLTVASDLC